MTAAEWELRNPRPEWGVSQDEPGYFQVFEHATKVVSTYRIQRTFTNLNAAKRETLLKIVKQLQDPKTSALRYRAYKNKLVSMYEEDQ